MTTYTKLFCTIHFIHFVKRDTKIYIFYINISFLVLPQLPNPPALQRVYNQCRIKSHFQSITFLQTIYYLERYIGVNKGVVIICRSGFPLLVMLYLFLMLEQLLLKIIVLVFKDIQVGW